MNASRKIIFTILALTPAKLLACAACYGGNIDSPMTDGMNWGILTLLVVVGTVLGAFLAFLIYAIRKSAAMEAARSENLKPKTLSA